MPSLCIAITLYAIISIKASGDYDPEVANELSNAIVEHYEFMHPVLLIPFIAIFVVAILKVPALPGILLLSGLGGVFAVVFQHANFSDLITMWHYGYEAETGNELCDSLLNKGGMDSMLWTNNLVIIAVGFGGILQTIRAVESILGGLIHKVRTVFQLVLVTIITGMFCITTMCDQYLGLIIPAAMYKDKYDEMGLGRNMLSRTMEDGGTLWSPLVPWSSCGAYHSNILGVSTLAYLPFCFMNLINPVFALVTSAMKVNIFWADGSRTGFTGKLRKGDPAGAPDDAHAKAMEALARIREEILQGHTIRLSIKNGFSKALSAILDGNITTLIAAIVLYVFGSGTIRVFAQTLGLGIVVSMISALLVTRVLLVQMQELFPAKKGLYAMIRLPWKTQTAVKEVAK